MKFGISYMIKLFMMTKKINREEVYNKCEGHCGYCGKEITIKQMQVDHIKPLYRNDKVTTLEVWGVERGSDNFDNLMPSCARCNRWKSTFSLEMFRKEIERQIERLNKYLELTASKLVLYTYDGFLIDFNKNDGSVLLKQLQTIIENSAEFPAKIYVGKDFNSMQKVNSF